MVRFALPFLLFWPGIALAWGGHYLLTEGALKNPSERDLATEQVKVERLEDFLKAEGPGLAKVIAADYDWLDAYGVPGRHTRQTYDPSEPTAEAFFRALRLNPTTEVPYVVRLMPTDPPPEDTLPYAAVSRYLYVRPPLRFDFSATPPGSTVTVDQVLRTYCEEPDWGIDFELWSHPEFGYGPEPYGKPTGNSSKAAFHMKFAHEPWLLRTFVPEITQGFPVERTELFARLSRFAFETGHPYWGWRFGAWAMHYVQDLAQPYHTRALPGVGNGYYLRYIFSAHKARMKKESTQLAQNRHYLYEDFVSYSLQQSYLEDTKLYKDLDGYLVDDPALLPGAEDPVSIADTVMARAAAHARALDATIVQAYGPHLTEDPSYNIETDTEYNVATTVQEVPPAKARVLLEEAGRDLANAAEATRSMIAWVSAVAPAPASSE